MQEVADGSDTARADRAGQPARRRGPPAAAGGPPRQQRDRRGRDQRSPAQLPAAATGRGLDIDRQAHRVSVDGRPVELSYREFELLAFLAEHPGRVFSRRQLVSSVWNGADVGSRTVDVHIRRLRMKLGPYAAGIVTVRNVGYRYEPARASLETVARANTVLGYGRGLICWRRRSVGSVHGAGPRCATCGGTGRPARSPATASARGRSSRRAASGRGDRRPTLTAVAAAVRAAGEPVTWSATRTRDRITRPAGTRPELVYVTSVPADAGRRTPTPGRGAAGALGPGRTRTHAELVGDRIREPFFAELRRPDLPAGADRKARHDAAALTTPVTGRPGGPCPRRTSSAPRTMRIPAQTQRPAAVRAGRTVEIPTGHHRSCPGETVRGDSRGYDPDIGRYVAALTDTPGAGDQHVASDAPAWSAPGIAGRLAGFFLARPAPGSRAEIRTRRARHATGRSAALYSEYFGPPRCARPRGEPGLPRRTAAGFADAPLRSPRGVVTVAGRAPRPVEGRAATARHCAAGAVEISPAEAARLVPAIPDESSRIT